MYVPMFVEMPAKVGVVCVRSTADSTVLEKICTNAFGWVSRVLSLISSETF